MILSNLTLSESKFIRYFKSFILLQGKHTGFYGNFGHGDLGDDAAFFVANKLFGGRLLPLSKRAYTFNPRNLNALLVGGGALFRWESPYLPRNLLTEEKWNFPIVVYSAGINCDYDKKFSQQAKDQIKKLCDVAVHITVRDELSRNFLKTLNVSNVSVLPDLEFLLDEREATVTYAKKGKTVGIVLSPHSEFDNATTQKITNAFAEFSKYLIEKGYQVVFLPFDQVTAENNREDTLIKEVLREVGPTNKVHYFNNRLSPQELLYVMKKYCDMMVGMRLHSCVFAANAGVPFICVGFNQMHKGLMQLLGKEELEVSLFDGFSSGRIIERFEYLAKNFTSLKDGLIKKRDELRLQIQNETQKIIELLEKS